MNIKQRIALSQVSFDYFVSCMNSGASVEEAKAEMLTENAQKEIYNRMELILE